MAPLFHRKNPSQKTIAANSYVIQRSEHLILKGLHEGVNVYAQKHPHSSLNMLQRVS